MSLNRGDRRGQPLTARQVQVLEQAALGLTSVEIAARLGMSLWTEKQHRRAIMVRLGVPNITAAVAVYKTASAEAVAVKISPGQLRAFHAKANELDRIRNRDLGASKRDALMAVSMHVDRELTSAGDLSSDQASWALDWLDAEIHAKAALAR